MATPHTRCELWWKPTNLSCTTEKQAHVLAAKRLPEANMGQSDETNVGYENFKSRMCAEICRKKKKRPAAFPSAARSWIQSAQPHVQHVARDESNDARAESPRFVIKKMSRFSRFPMFLILI